MFHKYSFVLHLMRMAPQDWHFSSLVKEAANFMHIGIWNKTYISFILWRFKKSWICLVLATSDALNVCCLRSNENLYKTHFTWKMKKIIILCAFFTARYLSSKVVLGETFLLLFFFEFMLSRKDVKFIQFLLNFL